MSTKKLVFKRIPVFALSLDGKRQMQAMTGVRLVLVGVVAVHRNDGAALTERLTDMLGHPDVGHIEDDGDGRADDPAERIGVADAGEAVRRCQPERKHDAQCEVCQRGRHKRAHGAAAAQHAVAAVFDADQRIKRCDGEQILHADVQNGFIGVAAHEQAEDVASRDEEQQDDAAHHQLGHEERGAHTLAHARDVLRADVLRRVARQRIGQRVHDHERECAHLERGGKAGDGVGAERIDQTLYEEDADRDKRLLADGRDGDEAHAAQQMRVKAGGFALGVDARQAADQRADGQNRRNALCDQRRPADTGDAHVKCRDKQHVEDDVECRGERKTIQRRAAVAQTVENRGRGIVEEEKQQAADVDAQIDHRRFKDVVRRVDDLHEQRARNLTDDRQYNGQRGQRDDGCVDCGAHLDVVVRAE